MTCKINPHILRYIEMVESGEIRACEEQRLLAAYVRRCFDTEDIHTDDGQLEHYLDLAKYFPFDRVFPWQEFFLGLHLCTYRADGMPRWPDAFALIGRGAGKDGTIALESVALMSPYNGIKNYNVDICANNEEQATRPVGDVIDMMESPSNLQKMRKHFYWTKEMVASRQTKSVLKGHTNSPKGKDGLRPGAVIFNEIHQYENYANINVFTTALGKREHPRRTYFTTNGIVRDGPLDDMLEKSERILRGESPDNGLLPFICKLDRKEEADDPENWQKANPSLPYLPSLMGETNKEYVEWKANPEQLTDFMTKRMNIPEANREIAVTEWANIEATKRDIPDLEGWNCTLGIDFVKVGDFASVNLHFREAEQRYDINHSWLCLKSADLPRIKAPWREWEAQGHLTVVDDVEIHPDLLCEWVVTMGQRYNIVKLALDNYRYALLANYLRQIGFDAKDWKNVKLVQPSDIMKVAPVIDSCFNNQNFVWGDNPPLRWATNNTMKVRSAKSMGSDTGNYYYAKIEGRSRKTDPFMALVASMTIEDELGTGFIPDVPDLGVIVG